MHAHEHGAIVDGQKRKRPQGLFSAQLIFWLEKSADCFSMVMCYDIIFQ